MPLDPRFLHWQQTPDDALLYQPNELLLDVTPLNVDVDGRDPCARTVEHAAMREEPYYE